MITKYFSDTELWKAKSLRYLEICNNHNMDFVSLEYVENFIPAWNITMVLNMAGYDYRVWYDGDNPPVRSLLSDEKYL